MSYPQAKLGELTAGCRGGEHQEMRDVALWRASLFGDARVLAVSCGSWRNWPCSHWFWCCLTSVAVSLFASRY